jgi:hypothetical protein
LYESERLGVPLLEDAVFVDATHRNGGSGKRETELLVAARPGDPLVAVGRANSELRADDLVEQLRIVVGKRPSL